MNNTDSFSSTKQPSSGRKEGLSLIVALGLLVIMALLAILFLTQSGTEKTSSTRRSDQARARMLAQSGLELVLDPPESGKRLEAEYSGEDYDADGERDQNALPNGKGEDGNGNRDGGLDFRGAPRYALRPSYALDQDDDQKPDLVAVRKGEDTYYRGISGQLPASKGGTDTYSVKMIDNNTKLNINSLNPHIGVLIDRLYREKTGKNSKPGTTKIIGPPSSVETRRKDVDQDGEQERLVSSAHRSDVEFDKTSMEIRGGYGSVDELDSVLGEKAFRVLKQYLTVSDHTWVDTSVVKPDPQAEEARAGVAQNPQNPGSAFAYDFSYQLQPRAPVRLNQVRIPMLTVLIQGLEARALRVQKVTNDTEGRAIHDTVNLGPIQRDDAREAAEKLHAYVNGKSTIEFRGESQYGDVDNDGDRTDPNEISVLQTWPEFEAFVDQKLVDEGTLSTAEGYLLKANFHPNTRPGKFNFNKNAIWSWMKNGDRFILDKTDFLYYTTEFCLHSGGYFSVHSYGRITDQSRRTVATSHLKAIIQKFQVLKHTTQQDFAVNQVTPSWQGGSQRTALYPESVENIPESTIKQGKNSGTTYSGQVSIAPKDGPSPTANDHYWSFDEPDQFTSSDDAPAYMSGTLSYGWQSREYGDVRDDDTDTNYGLMAGRTNPEEITNYPAEDPFNYSDVTPEGLLLGSDRNRVIRFPTGNDAFPADTWKEGHLEFWWKPKQKIDIEEWVETREASWWETFPQYVVKSRRMTFFEQFYLAESADIIIPHYSGTEYGRKGIDCTYMLNIPEVDGVSLERRTVPEFHRLNTNCGTVVSPDSGAAGFFYKFWMQNGRWYFLIRFRTAFSPRFETWEGPPRDHIDAGNILGGAVLTWMPVSGKASPKIGQWNRIVLNWKPVSYEMEYVQDGTVYPPETVTKEPRLLTGNFWINGKKSRNYKTWGEGNLRDTRIWISNLSSAENRDNSSSNNQTGTGPPQNDGPPDSNGGTGGSGPPDTGAGGGSGPPDNGTSGDGSGPPDSDDGTGSWEPPPDTGTGNSGPPDTGTGGGSGPPDNGTSGGGSGPPPDLGGGSPPGGGTGGTDSPDNGTGGSSPPGGSTGNRNITTGEMYPGFPPKWWKARDINRVLPTMIGPKRLNKYGSFGFLGGKIRRRGPKKSGELNPNAFYKSWWQSFVEGTIDDVIYTNDASNVENDGKGQIAERYYQTGGNPDDDPRYVGRVRRRTDSKWGGNRTNYNHYARDTQHLFDIQTNQSIEIVRLAHTQYRPKRDWKNETIPADQRSKFTISLKTASGSYKQAPDGWLGSPSSPETLFGESLVLDSGEAYLQYRVKAANADRSPQNVTPFFEGITIMYRPADQPVQIQSYYHK